MNAQIQRRWLMQRRSLVVLIGAVLWWASASPGLAEEDEFVATGKLYYQRYCASCHGISAKGDGPLAQDLKTKPADLTQLSKKNGGKFPDLRLYRTIDGREEVKGHGPREMPVWGTWFNIEIQENKSSTRANRVAGRILLLVHYLESIQGK